jgi:hypothetical protein
MQRSLFVTTVEAMTEDRATYRIKNVTISVLRYISPLWLNQGILYFRHMKLA